MGAEFNYRIYADKSGKKKIEQIWNGAVEESLHERGHSYSGCIGMLRKGIAKWHDEEFNSEDEASDFLCNSHQKWRNAEAVSFVGENGEKEWLIGGWCAS
jgi:hypothetical protein